MNNITTAGYVHINREKGRFQVDKRVFYDPEVFERERKFVFDRCWLYVAHESELARPGSFLTRQVGGYSVLFNRDRDGEIHAFHNLCMHRGVLLSSEKCGRANTFTCPYHGWVYSAKGELLDQGARSGYPAGFNADGNYNLLPVPRLENYRGFYFMNMNPRAVSLEKYLAGAKEWIDLIVDQNEPGLEVTPGEQEFRVNFNWKSISENQIDSYHGPSLHSTYFQYAAKRAGDTPQQQAAAYAGGGFAFGNGHGGFELGIKVGKPVAAWIPAFGEETRPLIEAKKAEILAKFGTERGTRMTTRTRNLLIFPNTILNDVLSLSIRTSYPETATSSRSNIWSLAPKGEDPLVRKVRLQNHLTFVGPGGFAHPDDYEMFDRRAIADQQSPPFLHDYSKGMSPGYDEDFMVNIGDQSDETQHRAWWTMWDQMLRGAGPMEG